jgi:hypothetical protein
MRHEPFLQRQARRVADRRHESGRCGGDDRSVDQEYEVGRGEQYAQRLDEAVAAALIEETADEDVAEQHSRRGGGEQVPSPVSSEGHEHRLAALPQWPP